MRWPWQRREHRDSGGDFSDAVVRLIEAQAAGYGSGRIHLLLRSRQPAGALSHGPSPVLR